MKLSVCTERIEVRAATLFLKHKLWLIITENKLCVASAPSYPLYSHNHDN